MNTYKVVVGTQDIVDVVRIEETDKDDYLLEDNFKSWEDAFVVAMEIKDALLRAVDNYHESRLLEMIGDI